jgi:hypothetical protein
MLSLNDFARVFGDRGYLKTLLMLCLNLCSKTHQTTDSDEMVGLGTLPYDLLLNIAFYLDLYDIHALHLVSTPPLHCNPNNLKLFFRQDI